eukprot:gene25169-10799_t
MLEKLQSKQRVIVQSHALPNAELVSDATQLLALQRCLDPLASSAVAQTLAAALGKEAASTGTSDAAQEGEGSGSGGGGAMGVAAAAAAQQLLDLIRTRCWRTSIREVHPDHEATTWREVVVPVGMTPSQAESYRCVLTQYYDVLACLKPTQSEGLRTGQLRYISNELLRVCSHPHLLSDSGGAAPMRGAQASGKMQMVAELLSAARANRQTLLLLSHSSKLLDLLESLAQAALGTEAVMKLAPAAPRSQLLSSMETLRTAGSAVQCVIMSSTCCGLATDLPQVDVAVLVDSDLCSRRDVQALYQAKCIGTPGKLIVLRLVTTECIEQEALELMERQPGVDTLCSTAVPVEHALAGPGPQLLNKLLRSGARKLLAPKKEAAPGAEAEAADAGGAAPTTDAGPSAGDPMAVDDTPTPSSAQAAPLAPSRSGGGGGTGDEGGACSVTVLPPTQEAVQELLASAAASATAPADVDHHMGGDRTLGVACLKPSKAPLSKTSPLLGAVVVRTWTECQLDAGVFSLPALPAPESPPHPGTAVSEPGTGGDAGAAMKTEVEGGGEPLDEATPAGDTIPAEGGEAKPPAPSAVDKAPQEANDSSFWTKLLGTRWEAYREEGGARGSFPAALRRDNGSSDHLLEALVDQEEGPVPIGGMLHGGAEDPGPGEGGEYYFQGAGGLGLPGGGSAGLLLGMGLAGDGGDGGGMYMGAEGMTLDPQGLGRGRGGTGGPMGTGGRGGRGSRNARNSPGLEGLTAASGGGARPRGGGQGGGGGGGLLAAGGGGGIGALNGQRGRRGDDGAVGSPEEAEGLPEEGVERPGKRKRRGAPPSTGGMPPEAAAALANGLLAAGSEGGEAGRPMPSPSRVRDILLREVARMEVVRQAISDPGSLEFGVAGRAYEKLKLVAQDLDMHLEVASNVADMARQVADILIIMRQEDDYTLVAITAVAAHLMKQPLGGQEGDYGLYTLSERYGHDATALDQVFWHILTRLSYYRELHVRSQQEGLDNHIGLGINASYGLQATLHTLQTNKKRAEGQVGYTGGAPITVTELVFAQVSQENIPLGPLATLMPLLQMAGVLNDANIKSALKQVQQIQKEYQDFMEKVRAKAQGAIDTANRDYQGAKTLLSGRMNLMVDYLQAQIPLQQLQHAAQQIQHAAQQAAQQQQQQQQAGMLSGGGALQQHYAKNGEDPGSLKASGLASLMNDPSVAVLAAAAGGAQGGDAHGGLAAAAVASLASASALSGLPVPTLTELVHAIARGQVPLEQIPEPLRSQLAALFTSGGASAALGGEPAPPQAASRRPSFHAPDALQMPASANMGQLQVSGVLIPQQAAALRSEMPAGANMGQLQAPGVLIPQQAGALRSEMPAGANMGQLQASGGPDPNQATPSFAELAASQLGGQLEPQFQLTGVESKGGATPMEVVMSSAPSSHPQLSTLPGGVSQSSHPQLSTLPGGVSLSSHPQLSTLPGGMPLPSHLTYLQPAPLNSHHPYPAAPPALQSTTALGGLSEPPLATATGTGGEDAFTDGVASAAAAAAQSRQTSGYTPAASHPSAHFTGHGIVSSFEAFPRPPPSSAPSEAPPRPPPSSAPSEAPPRPPPSSVPSEATLHPPPSSTPSAPLAFQPGGLVSTPLVAPSPSSAAGSVHPTPRPSLPAPGGSLPLANVISPFLLTSAIPPSSASNLIYQPRPPSAAPQLSNDSSLPPPPPSRPTTAPSPPSTAQPPPPPAHATVPPAQGHQLPAAASIVTTQPAAAANAGSSKPYAPPTSREGKMLDSFPASGHTGPGPSAFSHVSLPTPPMPASVKVPHLPEAGAAAGATSASTSSHAVSSSSGSAGLPSTSLMERQSSGAVVTGGPLLPISMHPMMMDPVGLQHMQQPQKPPSGFPPSRSPLPNPHPTQDRLSSQHQLASALRPPLQLAPIRIPLPNSHQP